MTDRDDLERRIIALHPLNATPEDDRNDLSAATGIFRGVLISIVGFGLLYLVVYAVLALA